MTSNECPKLSNDLIGNCTVQAYCVPLCYSRTSAITCEFKLVLNLRRNLSCQIARFSRRKCYTIERRNTKIVAKKGWTGSVRLTEVYSRHQQAKYQGATESHDISAVNPSLAGYIYTVHPMLFFCCSCVWYWLAAILVVAYSFVAKCTVSACPHYFVFIRSRAHHASGNTPRPS